jgi:6-phosphogluconate dehydrogenase (decarboxylating)
MPHANRHQVADIDRDQRHHRHPERQELQIPALRMCHGSIMVADSSLSLSLVKIGIEQGIPTPVISLALMARFASQGQQDFSSKLLAMMRNQFGDHAIRASDE